MSEEKLWQEKLVEKYPKLMEHCYPTVGDGWEQLLNTLCSQIQNYLDWKTKSGVTILEDGEDSDTAVGEYIYRPFFCTQKSKFGGLRAYHYGGDDYIRGLVDMAEAVSYHTCEECGNLGKERPTSWIRTLCDGCYENWEKIRAAKWGRE